MAEVKQYGTSEIPGDIVSVQSSGTVSVSTTFNSSVALIGGYDATDTDADINDATEDVSEGTAIEVSSGSEAADLFGTDSELRYAVEHAKANLVQEVWCVPVAETNGEEETVTGAGTGTLSNQPIFDPTVNPEHEILVHDDTESVDLEVNVVYGTPSQPSDTNVAEVNPVTGEWAADTSSDYTITYDHGDYASAIDAAVKKNVRFVIALTENESVANDLLSAVNGRATDFDFMRAVVGGRPNVTDPSTYSDNLTDQRIVVVEPPRGYESASRQVRTMAAYGGYLASQPLGGSATYATLNGLTGLTQQYTASEVADFTGVSVLMERNGILVAEGLTASTDSKFKDIYKCEIVDEVAYLTHLIARQYISRPNVPEVRDDLEDSTKNVLADMATDRPPLLAATDGTRPFSVNASVGAADDEVDLEIGIDVMDVIKTVDISINVGDVITYGGAS